ncbi:hypothetical protein PENSPDRAFT_34307 [Peniophora sp. CONT]|nr:hypothetical protein PENSPDRAFT_34307 [Peniophora sp. CONT]
MFSRTVCRGEQASVQSLYPELVAQLSLTVPSSNGLLTVMHRSIRPISQTCDEEDEIGAVYQMATSDRILLSARSKHAVHSKGLRCMEQTSTYPERLGHTTGYRPRAGLSNMQAKWSAQCSLAPVYVTLSPSFYLIIFMSDLEDGQISHVVQALRNNTCSSALPKFHLADAGG